MQESNSSKELSKVKSILALAVGVPLLSGALLVTGFFLLATPWPLPLIGMVLFCAGGCGILLSLVGWGLLAIGMVDYLMRPAKSNQTENLLDSSPKSELSNDCSKKTKFQSSNSKAATKTFFASEILTFSDERDISTQNIRPLRVQDGKNAFRQKKNLKPNDKVSFFALRKAGLNLDNFQSESQSDNETLNPGKPYQVRYPLNPK